MKKTCWFMERPKKQTIYLWLILNGVQKHPHHASIEEGNNYWIIYSKMILAAAQERSVRSRGGKKRKKLSCPFWIRWIIPMKLKNSSEISISFSWIQKSIWAREISLSPQESLKIASSLKSLLRSWLIIWIKD